MVEAGIRPLRQRCMTAQPRQAHELDGHGPTLRENRARRWTRTPAASRSRPARRVLRRRTQCALAVRDRTTSSGHAKAQAREVTPRGLPRRERGEGVRHVVLDASMAVHHHQQRLARAMPRMHRPDHRLGVRHDHLVGHARTVERLSGPSAVCRSWLGGRTRDVRGSSPAPHGVTLSAGARVTPLGSRGVACLVPAPPYRICYSTTGWSGRCAWLRSGLWCGSTHGGGRQRGNPSVWIHTVQSPCSTRRWW